MTEAFAISTVRDTSVFPRAADPKPTVNIAEIQELVHREPIFGLDVVISASAHLPRNLPVTRRLG